MKPFRHNALLTAARNSRAARYIKWQNACQDKGFSLLELIAVIGIICTLAALTAPIVGKARERARQVDCKSNLRQLGVGITTYRAAHHGRNPPWLSNLYPRYIDDPNVYVCKSDQNRGLGRSRPEGLPTETDGQQEYPETIDNESNPQRVTDGANEDIVACSYLYEFSAALCNFGWNANWGPQPEGTITWNTWKRAQLENGDAANESTAARRIPYSRSLMPIVRCYHHHDRAKVPGYTGSNGTRGRFSFSEAMTINVAYAGNVFVAPLWWEGTPGPGDINLKNE